ncbi:unnamed protein product, partial [Sphagnum compactum]
MATGAKSLGTCYSIARLPGSCISEMDMRASSRIIACSCPSSRLSFLSAFRTSSSSISRSRLPSRERRVFENHFLTVRRESRRQLQATRSPTSEPQLWQEEADLASVFSGSCDPSSRTTTADLTSPREWKQGVQESLSEKPFEGYLQAGSLQHDVGVTFLILLGAYAWVKLFNSLTKHQILGQKLSRKLVHITSGLLFALCWPFFSVSPWARYLAALVPATNGVRLLVYGLGILKDDGLVKSVSREGDPQELLRGPLYYVMVLVLCTVLFWRDSPVSVVSLAMMCAGDGIADIVGRRFGSKKLPYNSEKSWAGSITMFLFGFVVSLGCLWYFSFMGFYPFDLQGVALQLAAVSLAATLVESLPITNRFDDNLTVPLTTVILGLFLFPTQSI